MLMCWLLWEGKESSGPRNLDCKRVVEPVVGNGELSFSAKAKKVVGSLGENAWPACRVWCIAAQCLAEDAGNSQPRRREDRTESRVSVRAGRSSQHNKWLGLEGMTVWTPSHSK